MTDAQMITIAAAFLAAVIAVLFNNSRITDLRDSVNRHIDDKFALLSQQMKTMEEHIMRIVGDHESRLHDVEQRQFPPR
jgi:hypothetical protein